MSRDAGWIALQEFFEQVLEAMRSARPLTGPETSCVFETRAARDGYQDDMTARACAFVWPFLAQQQASGAVRLLLGNGTTIPAGRALFGVGNENQPEGKAVDLRIGTVGSARWPVEAENFSSPDDFREETAAETQVRHGPFLGCPIVIDRGKAVGALHELRHGPRASEKDIVAWAIEMRTSGGHPTRGIIIGEYKRNWPDATDESAEELWKQVRAAIPRLPVGRPKAEAAQQTDEFLEKKPRPETSLKPPRS